MNGKKVARLIAGSVFLYGILSAVSCSGKKAPAENADSKRLITIASSSSPAPWITVDDRGEPGGYDIDVIRLVFEKLPQYDTKYVVTEFSSIFTGLDSGMYQFGVNHLGYNRARGEKYLFSAPYDYGGSAILVKKGSPIRTVWDLGGHSTVTSPSSFNTKNFELYNAAHPDNEIKLHYTDAETEYGLDVSTGKYDFYLFTRFAIEQHVERTKLDNLEIIPIPREDYEAWMESIGNLHIDGNFYIYPKGEEQLQKEFDEVLLSLIDDGTIHALRAKYFGLTEADDYLTLDLVKSAREQIAKDQGK